MQLLFHAILTVDSDDFSNNIHCLLFVCFRCELGIEILWRQNSIGMGVFLQVFPDLHRQYDSSSGPYASNLLLRTYRHKKKMLFGYLGASRKKNTLFSSSFKSFKRLDCLFATSWILYFWYLRDIYWLQLHHWTRHECHNERAFILHCQHNLCLVGVNVGSWLHHCMY